MQPLNDVFYALEDEICNEHTQRKVHGIDIDVGIADLIEAFFDNNGVSYCCCQGYSNHPDPRLTPYNPIISSDDQYVIYSFDNDEELLLEKPFIIIHKDSLTILKDACNNLGWSIDTINIGTGEYACEWVDRLPEDESILFITLKTV